MQPLWVVCQKFREYCCHLPRRDVFGQAVHAGFPPPHTIQRPCHISHTGGCGRRNFAISNDGVPGHKVRLSGARKKG